MAAEARARKPVKAAVKTAPAEMAAVQVLTAVERAEKPPCRAQSFLSDSRGTVSSADWLFPCNTMQQPVPSTERCKNTLSQKLCYVQAEPHLKSGTKTVGELGPEKLGNLNPGQETTSSLSVASDPELAGVSLRRIRRPHGSVRLQRPRSCGSLRRRGRRRRRRTRPRWRRGERRKCPGAG